MKVNGEIPHYFTEESLKSINGGYLSQGESVKDRFKAVAKSICKYGNYDRKFYNALTEVTFHKGWLGYASPILSNAGTTKALPISCFIIDIADRMEAILGEGTGELAMLSKMGGGVGVSMQRIRSKGSLIKGGQLGVSEGVIPFAKAYESTVLASKQPPVRRGSASINLSIEHGDFHDFLAMRRVDKGNADRVCSQLHHCVTIPDSFMQKLTNKDPEVMSKWFELMKTRIETGEPYIMFEDTVNRANPEGYKKLGLTSNSTNICSEIVQYNDPDHTVVCCLSSLNLAKWDEWKDWTHSSTGLTLPEIAIYALDAIMEEFIQRAESIPFMQKAVRSAKKGRSLGLGVMGWHTYLQNNMMPFESFKTMQLNNEIFKFIHTKSTEASKRLGAEKGTPEWAGDTGVRNLHLIALAPTKTNSIICGDVSPSIEPYTANAYMEETSKGTFIRRNKQLEKVLERYNQNTDKVWKSIASNKGSVGHLEFLTNEEKEVYLTAYEINQKVIIQQAAQRQKYVCQAQSLNLFFPNTVDSKHFSDTHLLAWQLGVKTLYYCKSTHGVDIKSTEEEDCKACEG